jgi:hypothetical protein
MKKLLLLSALLIFACSSDDSNSSANNNTFNPPTWIQGIWLNSNSAGWEFRQDDICMLSLNQTVANCLMASSAAPDFSVYEEISEMRYLARFTNGGSEFTYEFEKISDNLISWGAVDGSVYERQ